jgi:cell division protein FtsN
VKDDTPPPRTKPVEPFAPKIPVAMASRSERGEKAAVPQSPRVEAKVSVPQNPRGEAEERKPAPSNPRSDISEKKPATVTVANVEKIESAARLRVPASEGKRAADDKNTETKPTLATAKKAPKLLAGWRVQVGATTYQETAQDMARELRELGYDPMVSKVQMNGETLYRVRIGKFGKQGEAVSTVGRFRREGRFSQAYLVSE